MHPTLQTSLEKHYDFGNIQVFYVEKQFLFEFSTPENGEQQFNLSINASDFLAPNHCSVAITLSSDGNYKR